MDGCSRQEAEGKERKENQEVNFCLNKKRWPGGVALTKEADSVNVLLLTQRLGHD